MKNTTLFTVAVGAVLNTNVAIAREDDATTNKLNPTDIQGGGVAVNMYNPHSVNPTPEEDVLFGKKIWRLMDLRNKSNRGFYAPDGEITKWIIEGVQAGDITPYKDEGFEQPMTQTEFMEQLKLPEEDTWTSEEKEEGFADDSGDWGKHSVAKHDDAKHAEHFLPREVSMLELVVNYFFDKKRCEIVEMDIQSIKLIIPADKFPTGLRRDVAIFRYKDLYDYFSSIPGKAIWKHPTNNRLDLSIPEAFAFGGFTTTIIKVENPDNHSLEDIYGSPKEAIKAARRIEEKFKDDASFLWEP
ncbi:MAG: gliding motility protein GldN [Bacteroidota bacterium]